MSEVDLRDPQRGALFDGRPAWWLGLGAALGLVGATAFWLDLAWRIRAW